MEGRAPDHSAGSRSPGPALRCKKTALGPCTEALLCPHPLLQQMHDHTVTQQLPMLPLAGASPGKLGSATAAIPCKRAGVCSAARLSCLLSRQPQTKTSVGSKKWVPLGKSNRCSSLRVLGTWWKAPSPGAALPVSLGLPMPALGEGCRVFLWVLLPSKTQQPGTVSLQRVKCLWALVRGSLVAPEPGEWAGSRQKHPGSALPCPGTLELFESTSSRP